MPSKTGERFERAVSIMARLRGPGGCPWDRDQTMDSIKPYTLEETYEVLEAIDNRDWPGLSGELGDLLLQILFYSQMADEQGTFSIDDVLDRLSDKLVRRHPHVFGDAIADSSDEVLKNWDAIKKQEKLDAGTAPLQSESVLNGVSSAMPALLEAHKLSAKAAGVGFDWPNIEGIFDKLKEEAEELRQEVSQVSDRQTLSDPLRQRVEEEIGDLFFVLVNMARYLSLDSESALRKSNRKFKRRFQWMEASLQASGRTPQDATADELESLWTQAKKQERTSH